jgi:hypothetical protein
VDGPTGEDLLIFRLQTPDFSQKDVEQGRWKYSSGADYWIVDIGESGQLGSGKYRYDDRENDF